MKTSEFYILVGLIVALASTAFAAAQTGETYGIVVWIFMSVGFLVVLAQLIPAVLVIAGFVKALSVHRHPQLMHKDV